MALLGGLRGGYEGGFGTASAFGFGGGVAGVIGVALEAAAEDGSGGVILFGLGLRTGLAGGAGIPPLLSSFLTFSIVFFTVVSVVVVDGWSVFTVVSVLAKCCKMCRRWLWRLACLRRFFLRLLSFSHKLRRPFRLHIQRCRIRPEFLPPVRSIGCQTTPECVCPTDEPMISTSAWSLSSAEVEC